MDREKRKSNRKSIMKPIEYFLVPSIIGKTCDGLIMDISDFGVCLLTTCQLKDRQRIIIKDSHVRLKKLLL